MDFFTLHNLWYLLATLALSWGFAVQYGVKGRLLVPSVVGATIGWLLLGALEGVLLNATFATFFASLFVSIWSVIWARLRKAPSTIFLIVGVLPLVPGRYIYLTMVELVENRAEAALSLGIETVFISLAITLAILLVSSTNVLIASIAKWLREIRLNS